MQPSTLKGSIIFWKFEHLVMYILPCEAFVTLAFFDEMIKRHFVMLFLSVLQVYCNNGLFSVSVLFCLCPSLYVSLSVLLLGASQKGTTESSPNGRRFI